MTAARFIASEANPCWLPKVLDVPARDYPEINDQVWSAAISENAADQVAARERREADSAAAPACPVCRDTGMVQCAEQDGSGMYEQACPEPIHDGKPCPACGGKGWTEAPGCNCGTPSWSLSSHEPYCGVEPCPRGCAFAGLNATAGEAPF